MKAAGQGVIIDDIGNSDENWDADYIAGSTGIGGIQSFNTTRRSIQGFEAMIWLRKGLGFAGHWTVHEQNRLLGFYFGLSQVYKA